MEPMRTSRRALLRAAGLGIAASALSSCQAEDIGSPPTSTTAVGPDATASPVPLASSTPTTLTSADFDALATCQLQPETTKGPFPLEEQLVRRDITEGYPGHPVRLGLRVVDADCVGVPDLAVEIWHTDATGDYSAFADGGSGKDEAGGTTFCRGTQVTNSDGIVEFLTIWPGWYPGRCVHFHLTVHAGDTEVLTTQLTFDDDATAEVFTTHEAYVEFGLPDTLVEDDFLSRNAVANGTQLAVTSGVDTDLGTGSLALLNLGVPV